MKKKLRYFKRKKEREKKTLIMWEVCRFGKEKAKGGITSLGLTSKWILGLTSTGGTNVDKHVSNRGGGLKLTGGRGVRGVMITGDVDVSPPCRHWSPSLSTFVSSPVDVSPSNVSPPSQKKKEREILECVKERRYKEKVKYYRSFVACFQEISWKSSSKSEIDSFGELAVDPYKRVSSLRYSVRGKGWWS